MHTFLIVLLVIVCITLIVSILLQPTKQNGLAGFIPGGGSADTFFSKNKTRTFEANMRRLSIASAVVFAILVVLINVIK